jgi:hypothetical protein
MRDAWASHESWVYECLACATVWEEEFDINHTDDGHGGEAVVYERDGQRCTSPWTDHVCPSCRSQNVKVFASQWRHEQESEAGQPSHLELVFKLRKLHAY